MGKKMKSLLKRKALFVSYFTVLYNIIEGLLSIFFGAAAGSIALIGFGLDSFVESLSGVIMIWRFSHHPSLTKHQEEQREKRAIHYIGYMFLILAVYVAYESVQKLYLREIPEPSFAGVVIAGVSIVVMYFLFHEKQRIAQSINSRSLIVDSKQTLACIFLSVALLIGLGLNKFFGLWQADPIVGLIICYFLSKEGYEAIKEGKVGCC